MPSPRLCSALLLAVALLFFRQASLPEAMPMLAMVLCALAMGLVLKVVSCRLDPVESSRLSALTELGARLGLVLALLGLAGLFCLQLSVQRLADRPVLPPSGLATVTTFTITSLPSDRLQHGQRLWRFEALVDLPEQASQPVPALMGWSLDEQDPHIPAPGDRYRAALVVKPATGTRNWFGFDLETWLFQNQLSVSASVRSGKRQPAPEALPPDRSWSVQVHRLRALLRDAIRKALPDAPHAAVMAGLVMGDQNSISAQDWALFSKTGVSHLMSISGMHVTMFALLARQLVRGLWWLLSRRPLQLALWLPVQPAAAVSAALGAMAYALLAGFNLPAQRTAIMVTVAAVVTLMGVASSRWTLFWLTLLVMLLLDPSSVLSPGFWLSFLAVALLFGQPDASSAWKGAVRTQAAITVGLAPLTVVFFQQVSLVGPLANAVAIPVVTFLVTPLAMLGTLTVWLGLPQPLELGHWCFAQVHACLVWLSSPSWASLAWPAPPAWAVVGAVLGPILALMPMPVLGSWRHLGWLGLLLLATGGDAAPGRGQFETHVLDIGQGTAILVRTQTHALLIDTGPVMGASLAADRVVQPELSGLGVRKLDGLIVSHSDEDHASGMLSAVSAFRPDWLLANLKSERMAAWQHLAPQGSAPLMRCGWGQGWVWDEVWFRVIHPLPHAAEPSDKIRGSNHDSCGLEILDAAGHRVVVLGDLFAIGERELVRMAPWLGRREAHQGLVLLAPHHGSQSSTSQALLDQLRPNWVVTQSAYFGRFGHPHASTLARLQAAEIPLLRTDLQGGLRLMFAPDGQLQVRSAAEETRRFWHLQRQAH